MNFFKNLFKVYLNPTFWISNYGVNKKVDFIINQIIDQDLVSSFDEYNAYCDSLNIKIWIGNYPYAFGSVKGTFPNYLRTMDGLPKRITRLKLKEYLKSKGRFNQVGTGIKEVDKLLGIQED